MQNSFILMACLASTLLVFSCNTKDSPTAQNKPNCETKPLSNVATKDRLNFYDTAPEMTIDPDKKYTAVITTEKGEFVVELNAINTPLHSNNFVFLARQGFYDGLTFHRVEPGFVIQGGDPLANSTGGPGYTIPAEFGLLHDEGVLAMARRGDSVNPEKRSSGSQFYITLAPAHFLDNDFSVFGKVVEGFEVVKGTRVGHVIVCVEIIEE